MCDLSQQIAPLETPTQGVYIADAGQLTYMGKDVVRLAAMLPGSIPAHGFVVLAKKAGAWRFQRLAAGSLGEARSAALNIGKRAMCPVVLGEVARMGGDPLQPVFLISAVSMFEPVTKGDLLRKAINAADDIVEDLALLRPVSKSGDPFSRRGFEAYTASLVKDLEANFGLLPQRAITRAIAEAGFGFATATESQINRFVDEVNKAMREALGPAEWTAVRNSFKVNFESVRKGAAKSVVRKYDLSVSTSLSMKDEAAIARGATAQTTFVRETYGGVICPRTSAQARTIIHRGMDEGLGSRAIGRDMRRELGRYVRGQNRDYFSVVADAGVARSREHASLLKYAGADVAVVRYSSVLDERTTETCRWLDGKPLSVSYLGQRYDEMGAAKDPGEVNWRLPWLRETTIKSGDDKGKRAIMLAQKDGWKQVAVVQKAGFGTWDKGSYKGLGMKDLQALGIGPPPLHGHCRTTTIPDIV
jgi:hypothetical protein